MDLVDVLATTHLAHLLLLVSKPAYFTVLKRIWDDPATREAVRQQGEVLLQSAPAGGEAARLLQRALFFDGRYKLSTMVKHESDTCIVVFAKDVGATGDEPKCGSPTTPLCHAPGLKLLIQL